MKKTLKWISDVDPIVRTRVVDAIEKKSKINSKYIYNYKAKLIYEIIPKVKENALAYSSTHFLFKIKLLS